MSDSIKIIINEFNEILGLVPCLEAKDIETLIYNACDELEKHRWILPDERTPYYDDEKSHYILIINRLSNKPMLYTWTGKGGVADFAFFNTTVLKWKEIHND